MFSLAIIGLGFETCQKTCQKTALKNWVPQVRKALNAAMADHIFLLNQD